MARANRKKQRVSWTRIALIVMALLWGVLAAAWWSLRQRGAVPNGAASSVAVRTVGQESGAVKPPSAKTEAGFIRLNEDYEIRKPPRDEQFGISANTVLLRRLVTMYQWIEHCDGATCRYEQGWSPESIDSSKFRVPAGHRNPPMPFAEKIFYAGEVKDPTTGRDYVPKNFHLRGIASFPVEAAQLPPNLAATFNVSDGVLYAGGDAAHPQIGTLRIEYQANPKAVPSN